MTDPKALPKPEPERPDRTPENIVRRPIRLSRMRKVKIDRCTCRKPVAYHRADGRVTCSRCKGEIEEAEK